MDGKGRYLDNIFIERLWRSLKYEEVFHIYDLDDERESNTIEVFIRRIRRKLGVDAIQTVRGLGYRLEAP